MERLSPIIWSVGGQKPLLLPSLVMYMIFIVYLMYVPDLSVDYSTYVCFMSMIIRNDV